METYNPAVIEKKWQEFWRKTDVFHATLDPSKKKYYALVEFPYPSGQGLHVGHPRRIVHCVQVVNQTIRISRDL